MTSSDLVLVAAVFLASAVEMVEALTVVLAVGVTRGWRSSIEGVLAALVVLAAIVVAFGSALVKYVPIDLLRSVVGGVLLIFGLQWLRKAVLRASGFKEKRDENLVYAATVAKLSSSPTVSSRDMQAFTVAFKGVFIEGLEVIIIVLTLGSSAHNLGLATASAATAVVLVGAIGIVVSRQLSGVPENAMKMVVGLMLISFGTFWGGEGLGMHWPGSDLMIPVLVLVYGLVALVLVRSLSAFVRVGMEAPKAKLGLVEESHDNEEPVASGEVVVLTRLRLPLRLVGGFTRFWWDFLVGDTPEIFAGALLIFAIAELLLHSSTPNVMIVIAAPVQVILLLNTTVMVAYRSEKRRS